MSVTVNDMLPEIVIVHADDWMALYLDGALAFENLGRKLYPWEDDPEATVVPTR